jgi:Carboxypeptidase regulatory-like domain
VKHKDQVAWWRGYGRIRQSVALFGWISLALPGCLAAQAAQTPSAQTASPEATRRIVGRILDRTGTGVAGAKVTLDGGDRPAREVSSDGDGQFSFASVPPGAFHLTIAAAGFANQEFSGELGAEDFTVPAITLPLASVVTEVRVVPPQIEIAEAQIKEEEKQRALGFIPNYYVSYVADAAPLVPRQKFELAWKTMVDPVSFAITGAVAGVEQARNDFSGYGQGADGYAKRYGAAYANFATSTLLGSAALPSLFKQDPRYFYKGAGSKRSRALYALANSVVCKGDNGRWQANYSAILGGLASGGISNLYYPAKDRNGAALTFENALIGIGATAAANLFQEFVVRKLTPNLPAHDPAGKARNLVGRALITLVHEGG